MGALAVCGRKSAPGGIGLNGGERRQGGASSVFVGAVRSNRQIGMPSFFACQRGCSWILELGNNDDADRQRLDHPGQEHRAFVRPARLEDDLIEARRQTAVGPQFQIQPSNVGALPRPVRQYKRAHFRQTGSSRLLDMPQREWPGLPSCIAPRFPWPSARENHQREQ